MKDFMLNKWCFQILETKVNNTILRQFFRKKNANYNLKMLRNKWGEEFRKVNLEWESYQVHNPVVLKVKNKYKVLFLPQNKLSKWQSKLKKKSKNKIN